MPDNKMYRLWTVTKTTVTVRNYLYKFASSHTVKLEHIEVTFADS